tara:strand:- start:233 stop:397 length:165 start_codon:yes stop_codon:yes gene_type:complete
MNLTAIIPLLKLIEDSGVVSPKRTVRPPSRTKQIAKIKAKEHGIPEWVASKIEF